MKKKPKEVNHSFHDKGFKKVKLSLFTWSLMGAINPTPDLINGNVKSTYDDLFASMVVSPTTASYLCDREKKALVH